MFVAFIICYLGQKTTSDIARGVACARKLKICARQIKKCRFLEQKSAQNQRYYCPPPRLYAKTTSQQDGFSRY